MSKRSEIENMRKLLDEVEFKSLYEKLEHLYNNGVRSKEGFEIDTDLIPKNEIPGFDVFSIEPKDDEETE